MDIFFEAGRDHKLKEFLQRYVLHPLEHPEMYESVFLVKPEYLCIYTGRGTPIKEAITRIVGDKAEVVMEDYEKHPHEDKCIIYVCREDPYKALQAVLANLNPAVPMHEYSMLEVEEVEAYLKLVLRDQLHAQKDTLGLTCAVTDEEIQYIAANNYGITITEMNYFLQRCVGKAYHDRNTTEITEALLSLDMLNQAWMTPYNPLQQWHLLQRVGINKPPILTKSAVHPGSRKKRKTIKIDNDV